jgi:hypothetical protein
MLDRPALNLAIVDDEPETIVAPALVLDRAALDRRRINRLACKHFHLLYHTVVDRYGRSLIRDLGPGYRANPDGIVAIRDALPRLITFSGPNPDETDGGPGAWCSRGNGAHGHDVISLIEYLGGVDRGKATEWLRDWTDRLVEIKS